MSGPDLTARQHAAMTVAASSVALSAGAGCGKTTVLTGRFLWHLESEPRVGLRRIVALTFTDKAARELRDRVRAACLERLERGEDGAYWRGVLRELEAAPIGTFHGFCGQVLRRFALEAGVEPGFAIVEEPIAASLRDRALVEQIKRWLAEGDADFLELATDLGLGRLRQELRKLLVGRSTSEQEKWLDRDPAEVVAAWEERFGQVVLPAILDEMRGRAEEALRAFPPEACAKPAMVQRRAALAELVADGGPGAAADPAAWLAALREQAQVKGTTAKTWADPEAYERVKDAFTGLRKQIDDTLKALAWDREASLAAAARGLAMGRLLREAAGAYQELKRQAGVLDFDDLLTHTRDLLKRPPEAVRRWLDGSIGAVLVDEFQDTDPIQAEILEALLGVERLGGRLFLVGDVKQSIYGFRRARPELFARFRDEVPQDGRRELTENFRSVPELLDFVNVLFAEEFPGAEHRLEPGPRTPARGDRAAVCFAWAKEADWAERNATVKVRRACEARWLARLVARRLEEGSWLVRERGTGEVRPARAGDVVFLFRTLKDAGAYEAALVREGLDYYVVGGSAFYGQQEVLDVINILTAIEDPCDALALAASLRSPFGCVSDAGLYVLATAQGDLRLGLEGVEGLAGLSPDDRRRARELRERLHAWRGLKDRVPIAELLDRVLEDSGYEIALLAEFLGERRRANVRKLVRMARRFDQQGGMTLADFVERLRADWHDPPREEQAATTDEEGDAVRLMTIHQAKGLEFPVVVLADLDRGGDQRMDGFGFHPELGFLAPPPEDPERPKAEDASLGRRVARELERRADRAEALRVFYVATTRARDYLVLSAGREAGEAVHSPAMELLARRFDLESGACRCEAVEGVPAPRVQVLDAEPAPVARRGRRGTSRALPRMLRVAQAIEQAPACAAAGDEDAPRIARPRFLDLEPGPFLPPESVRVERVVRACLADPRLTAPGAIDTVLRDCPEVRGRFLPESVLRAARERLRLWLEHPLAGKAMVARGLPWCLPWPDAGKDAMVIRGWLDGLAEDEDGGRVVVSIGDAAEPLATRRLRCVLSARAGGEEAGRVVAAWRVALGEAVEAVREPSWDRDVVEGLIDEVLRGARR